jgi:rubrerythrin
MIEKYLNADEILKVSMNTEQEGISFYKNAAKHSNNSVVKDIFIFLAEEEKKHYEYFKKINEGEIKELEFRPVNINDEISIYLRYLIKPGIFKKEFSKETWKNFTDKSAIEFGIEIEKRSILYYSQILQIIENKSGKSGIWNVLEEEKRHLVKLTSIWQGMTNKRI